MTSADQFESMIAAWLGEAGRRRAPRETLDAVLERTRTTRPLPGWRARVAVRPMRREAAVLVGSPITRRFAIASAVAVVALAAVLLVVGAMAVRTKLSQAELFVYVTNPASLPSEFCAEVVDCRNGLAGWPGGRFLVSQRVGESEPTVLVEAPWPSTIFDPRVAPDGMHLAYARAQIGFPATCLQLIMLDLSSGEEHVVAEIAGGWGWTVDPARGGGARLLFTASGRCSPGGNGVFAYDATTRTTTMLFDVAAVLGETIEPRFGRQPVWFQAVHPEGRRVLISVLLSDTERSDTFVLAIDGASPPEAVRCDCTGAAAAWSPDGTSILIEQGFGALLIGRDDFSQLRTVTDLADSPAWSPDGSTVAYLGPAPDTGVRRYSRGIYVVDVSAGEPVQIAGARLPYAAIMTPPRWSPDGAWVYWSDTDATWAIRPDGTDLRQLALPAQIDLLWLNVEGR